MKRAMQNPNEVPEPRQRGRLRRMNLVIAFWSSLFVRFWKAGREARQDWAQQACSHSPWSCSDSRYDVGREEEDILEERAVGMLGGTGNPLCPPSLHTAFTEPREEKDLPSTLGI